MPKARTDGLRLTRCTNMPGYEKKAKKGVFDDAQKELYNREAALCEEVSEWINSDRDEIVDLLLSPQGMARGYLYKWVEYAEKRDIPTLPGPSDYANGQQRDTFLRANFTELVKHVCNEKVTGLLLTLKGEILRNRKKGSTEYVPLVEPNGEVDRVMRIWPVLKKAYEDVVVDDVISFKELAKVGLEYVHPNEG